MHKVMAQMNRVHTFNFFTIVFITTWFYGFNTLEIRGPSYLFLFMDMDKAWTASMDSISKPYGRPVFSELLKFNLNY
ncbi:hypothetical protein DN53_00495 [Flagellimonas olearia]|uniref:Uncharacterized protein n=1 Tax=Flagellimonas olearia TaxID=552546 RepID=A0A444VQ16_9FLAO|nr:hypothetical protein DN53_00495 [Allomuricauda olearia]